MITITQKARQQVLSIVTIAAASAIMTGCSGHGPNTAPTPAQLQQIMQQAKANAATPPGGPNYVRPNTVTAPSQVEAPPLHY